MRSADVACDRQQTMAVSGEEAGTPQTDYCNLLDLEGLFAENVSFKIHNTDTRSTWSDAPIKGDSE